MVQASPAQIIAALPSPVMLIGADERIAAVNPAAVALFGPEAEGRHYITALRQPALLDTIEAVQGDGAARTTRYLGRSGDRDTTFDVAVARAGTGRQAAIVLTFEDRTAIEAASRMRRDFVANVSHELRTPLTALLGFIETLRGPAREDAAAQRRFLTTMQREAARMARLVEDLLSLSRVEQNERMRPMDEVDLGALAQSAAAGLAPVAEGAGARVEVEVPAAAVMVAGDAGQLRQILNNLVENAIKYGRPGGRVLVRVSGPQMEPSLRSVGVRMQIIDEGEGIAAHHVPRLTERFYRVDTHRSREVGGTGLGLAIVKHIVNRHRGRLRIESAPGKGSTFSVILPGSAADEGPVKVS